MTTSAELDRILLTRAIAKTRHSIQMTEDTLAQLNVKLARQRAELSLQAARRK